MQYTEIGYDLVEQVLHVDHSRCCAASNTVVQRAPLSFEQIVDTSHSGAIDVEMAVFVDGGLIEAFGSDRVVITALVSPDERSATPGDRHSWAFNNGPEGLHCITESWYLIL